MIEPDYADIDEGDRIGDVRRPRLQKLLGQVSFGRMRSVDLPNQ
jgi:hypothetical protein